MRPSLSLLGLAATLAVAPATLAAAADYSPPIFVDQAPEYKPVEVGSGWYLRGDVGYSLETSANDPFTYRTFDPGPPATYSSDTFDSVDLSEGFNFGLGFGYHFNDWLRADATLERIALDFEGTRTSATPCGGGTGCRMEDFSSLHGYSAMLNGYVDLGTFVGITPYVGAGAGYTYVAWDTLESNAYCTGAGCGPVAFQGTTTHPGESSWRFTYALMAGLAYDITPNLKVDLGYKYRRISDGAMFGWDSASRTLGATGTQGHDGGFSQHEVRVGLRYELW